MHEAAKSSVMPPGPTLPSLPTELLLEIHSYFTHVADVESLRATCRLFRSLLPQLYCEPAGLRDLKTIVRKMEYAEEQLEFLKRLANDSNGACSRCNGLIEGKPVRCEDCRERLRVLEVNKEKVVRVMKLELLRFNVFY